MVQSFQMNVQAKGICLLLLCCGAWAQGIPQPGKQEAACKPLDAILEEIGGQFTTFSYLLEAAGLTFGNETSQPVDGAPLLMLAPTDDVFDALFDQSTIEDAVQNATSARRLFTKLSNMLLNISQDGLLNVAMRVDDASHAPEYTSAVSVLLFPDAMIGGSSTEVTPALSNNATLSDYEFKLIHTCHGGLVVPSAPEQYTTRLPPVVIGILIGLAIRFYASDAY